MYLPDFIFFKYTYNLFPRCGKFQIIQKIQQKKNPDPYKSHHQLLNIIQSFNVIGSVDIKIYLLIIN